MITSRLNLWSMSITSIVAWVFPIGTVDGPRGRRNGAAPTRTGDALAPGMDMDMLTGIWRLTWLAWARRQGISMIVTRAFRTGCMAGQSPNKPGAVRRSTADVPRTPAVGHPCHPGVMRSVTGAAAISRRAAQPPLCHPRNVMQFARTRGNLRPAWTASIGPSATCLLAVTMPVLSDTVRCKLSAVFAVPAVLRRPVVHCMWRLPQPSTATRH